MACGSVGVAAPSTVYNATVNNVVQLVSFASPRGAGLHHRSQIWEREPALMAIASLRVRRASTWCT